jgi:hypothetical protein
MEDELWGYLEATLGGKCQSKQRFDGVKSPLDWFDETGVLG